MPRKVNSRPSSTSSLSSLSQLDEAVALAELEIEKENRKNNKSPTHPLVYHGKTVTKGGNAGITRYNNGTSVVKHSGMTGRRDSKTVTFGEDDDVYDDAASVAASKKVDIGLVLNKYSQSSFVNGFDHGLESSEEKKRNGTAVHDRTNRKENGDMPNGSVNASVNNPNSIQVSVQPVNQNTQHTNDGKTLVNGTDICNPPSPQICVENPAYHSHNTYTRKADRDSSQYDNVKVEDEESSKVLSPPPPPVSTIPKNRRPDNISIKPEPAPSIVGSKPEFLSDVYVAEEEGAKIQPASITGSQPPPPAPPPPPPVPVVNGNQSKPLTEEIKKKSASLPARCVA